MINNEIKSDIFAEFKTGKYDLFVQGCNCFCTQGAGVARILSNTYPEVLEADRKTKVGDKNKLGCYTLAETKHGTVVNLYTQFRYGTDRRHVDYDKLRVGFTNLNRDFAGKSICTVRIGAGLAGGDWDIIKDIINKVTPDLKIDVYYI